MNRIHRAKWWGFETEYGFLPARLNSLLEALESLARIDLLSADREEV